MKLTKIILISILLVACNDGLVKENQTNEKVTKDFENSEQKRDTTKLFQKISIIYGEENKINEEYEGYISKQNDTIWNQWKFYNNGVIDSLKSKFYELSIEKQKNDTIFKGRVSFFSPGDSISKLKIDSRKVSFIYLQKENDSLIFKEIITDKNIIEFEYRDFENLSFVGYISDLRFVRIDSLPEKLLVNRNYFALDSEISTDNTFVELLK